MFCVCSGPAPCTHSTHPTLRKDGCVPLTLATNTLPPHATQALAQLQARLEASEASHQQALKELAAAQAALQEAQAASVREREKLRGDQTVLAREIKRLRGELAQVRETTG